MTTDNDTITNLGLFLESLDMEIKHHEEELRSSLRYAARQIERALKDLDAGTRPSRSGVLQNNSIDIDKVCGLLCEKYDLRNHLTSALKADAKAAAARSAS